jgi:hypothetical protein
MMQHFTSLKPRGPVGPVCFGLFGYNLGKTMFYSDFEKEQVTKFAFLCFKMNGNQLYWMNYIK